MRAIVDFLKMPVALSTGEYPLLSSLDQDLAAYIVGSVTLNVRKDLAQTIRLPWEVDPRLGRSTDLDGARSPVMA